MSISASTVSLDAERVLATGSSIALLILGIIILSVLLRSQSPAAFPAGPGPGPAAVSATPLQSALAGAPASPQGRSFRPPVAEVAAPIAATSAPRAIPARARDRRPAWKAAADRTVLRAPHVRPSPAPRAEPITDDLYEDAAAAGMTARAGRDPDGAADTRQTLDAAQGPPSGDGQNSIANPRS